MRVERLPEAAANGIDSLGTWDDDMIVGSVHFVEYIELLFWLKEVGYDGWYSMDQYPSREDGAGALRGSVEFLMGIESMLQGSAVSEIREAVQEITRVRAWRFPSGSCKIGS